MKKLKFLVGAVALFALVVVNVWNAATVLSTSELDITNVESIVAEGDVNGGSGAWENGVESEEDCTVVERYVVYPCGTKIRLYSVPFPAAYSHTCSSCRQYSGRQLEEFYDGIQVRCPYLRGSQCYARNCRKIQFRMSREVPTL